MLLRETRISLHVQFIKIFEWIDFGYRGCPERNCSIIPGVCIQFSIFKRGKSFEENFVF